MPTDKKIISSQTLLHQIGKLLQENRLVLNLTQESLAEKVGVTRRTITNIEGGNGGSLITFIDILGVLGLQKELLAIFPDNTLSPVQLSKLHGKMRQRASGKTNDPPTDQVGETKWEWGE